MRNCHHMHVTLRLPLSVASLLKLTSESRAVAIESMY